MNPSFPNASKSFQEQNPAIFAPMVVKNDSTGILSAAKGKRRGSMNATEREFSLILEAMKQKGEIDRWEFEGITLRFQGLKFTPDFTIIGVRGCSTMVKFIEIKGAFISGKFERAIERFRHARTYYPEFDFEMHQKTREGWKQIL